ncbi:MAG: RagB/SusD family nutrient uptake outer membrane protein, partial [Mucilaginibacter polytrichastri]|nr:RagB/SusD family nutrient uptake outer membrane protein [Mucilaginibacter polytrichastri]
EVYAQILKDLNEAETELPGAYTGSGATLALLNTTRAHKNSAVALKTRVYLTMGRYQDVITEGNKIVSTNAPFTAAGRGVVNALQGDVTAIYKSPYTSLESVFSFPMATTNAPGTQNQLGYYFNSGGGANLEYYLTKAASGILASPQWGAADVRKTAFVAAQASAKPYLTKFSNVAPFTDFVPSIRYAEVLLNVAEAEARVGSQTRGQAILEAVHKRSDASYAFAGGGQTALVNAILTERRIELLGEGFRTIDFMRLGLPIQSSGAGQAIPTNDVRYVWPIPTAEVQTNPGL